MAIDVQSLLEPVSAELPCGEDLSRDPAFIELEDTFRSKDKSSMVPAEAGQGPEETDWAWALSRAVELLGRTKDLRLVMYLTVAALQQEGLAGMRSSLAVLDGMLEKYWEVLHPRLSPEDNYDPQVRLSAIAFLHSQSFGDRLKFLSRLRDVPLCGAPGKDRFALRHLLIATGEMAGTEAEDPTLGTIHAALKETPGEELQEKLEAVQQSEAVVQRIEKRLDEKVGAGKAPGFQELRRLLQQVNKHLSSALAGKGLSPAEGVQVPPGAGPAQSSDGGAAMVAGEIRSPQDVIRVLEKVCQYYARHEPSSPVPLLVRRAQRLVSKDFLDIVRDLTPGAMDQIGIIGGLDKPPAQG